MDNLILFLAQNPWQKGQKLKTAPFIKRDMLNEVIKWLGKEEIVTLTGPRQAGKTTVLLKTIEYLLKERKENPSNIYYFNFDQVIFKDEFSQPQTLLSFVKSRSNPGKIFLFLDEVQRLKEPGVYLKILYDLPEKLFKIIVSGSSSLLLRAKTQEHLTGRQIAFHLLPLSFKEASSHLGFKLPSPLSDILGSFFREFAVYGGYPKPFGEQNQEIKRKLLFNLYQDYVKKDIRDFAAVENLSSFNKLTSLLAYQIGNLINKNELASSCQADFRTVERYLEILEETFVIRLLKPYFSNRRKEIVKSPKAYYLDNGLRNAQLNSFTKYTFRPDRGVLFENLVFSELCKYLPQEGEIRFWRTQAGTEVDFVLVLENKPIPIEVKANLKNLHLTSGLRSFIENYQPKKAYLLSENPPNEKIIYKKTEIKLLPFSQLLEIFP